MKCPNCGDECCRDEVDISVGIMYGPWGCYGCGWSEWREYDRRDGVSEKEKEVDGYYVDPCGHAYSHRRMAERLENLGLLGKEIIGEVFRDSE